VLEEGEMRSIFQYEQKKGATTRLISRTCLVPKIDARCSYFFK